MRPIRRVKATLSAVITALILCIGIAVAAPASATTAQKFQGQACPNGYITNFIWSGPSSSGYGSFGGNVWSFTDYTYNGSGHYEIAVQCNNGVFYYPHFNVTGYAGTWYIGWI